MNQNQNQRGRGGGGGGRGGRSDRSDREKGMTNGGGGGRGGGGGARRHHEDRRAPPKPQGSNASPKVRQQQIALPPSQPLGPFLPPDCERCSNCCAGFKSDSKFVVGICSFHAFCTSCEASSRGEKSSCFICINARLT
jgi:hypothetical protein